MNNDNSNIEKLLQCYQPAGPADDLHNRIFNRSTPTKANRFRVSVNRLAIAASVTIVGSLALLYFHNTSFKPIPQPNQLALTHRWAQIEREIEQAGQAAQLLAVADMFAAQIGGRDYAIEQYQKIINDYPNTIQVEQAKQKLLTIEKGV